MDEMKPVVQADREAAAALGGELGWHETAMADVRAGTHDYWPMVFAFATHRLAAYEAGVRAGLEAAAAKMEDLCFFTPIEDLLEMTKQDMSVRTCREGAAKIRAIDPSSITPDDA